MHVQLHACISVLRKDKHLTAQSGPAREFDHHDGLHRKGTCGPSQITYCVGGSSLYCLPSASNNLSRPTVITGIIAKAASACHKLGSSM